MSAKTDRELLELAAKAAGMWPHAFELDDDNLPLWSDKHGFRLAWGAGWWHAGNDDGDALRLAVACKIDLKFYGDHVVAWWQDYFGTGQIPYGGDPQAATRRAIVRAAAEIGAQQ